MRAVWVAVVVLACRKAEPPAPAPEQPAPVVSGDAGAAAAVTDAAPGDAAAAQVELLRSVPTTVRVSSTVRNKAILPAHLVDRDLSTAWNSATGELAGAWIDVDVAPGAAIQRIRLTAGHTGKGPRGEDYFTMNPRIRLVELIADGSSIGTFPLDIEHRGLQSLAVAAQHRLRIAVVAVEPGSKKAWREVNVSELEVWGTPPAGWTAPPRPLVPSVEVGEPAAASGGPCSDVEARRAGFAEQHKGEVYTHPDHSYPPSCDVVELGAIAGDPQWATSVAWCDIYDEIYGPTTCNVQFERGGQTAGFSMETPLASSRIKLLELAARDVIPGGDAELVVRFDAPAGEHLVVCRAAPALACTAPIAISTGDWRVAFRFDAGELVLDPVAGAAGGSPPTGVIGRHPLVFQ